MSCFPQWTPQFRNASKFDSSDFRIRYKALRNSSSAFIKRADVRKYIFERDNFTCYICGSKENLQIDHIVSVYSYANHNIRPIESLNEEHNLRTICAKCNSSKAP